MESIEAAREPNQSTAANQSDQNFAQVCSEYRVDPDRFPLSRTEILNLLRVDQESRHHLHISEYCASKKWLISSRAHQPVDLDHTSTLRDEDAATACNRTAAVYLLRDDWLPHARPAKLPHVPYTLEDETTLIAAELFRYTYRRWFRPYKSEIDRGQFLTKVNVPRVAIDLPAKTCSLAMVERLRRSHANFCDRVRDTMANEPLYAQLAYYRRDDGLRRVPPFYFLQPVFEAVIVAVRTGEFDFATTDIADIADMRTLVVATGKEAKSGPIDLLLIDAEDHLDSVSDNGRLVAVESPLEVIISFLLGLEHREHALGMQPDPAKTSRDMPVYDMDIGVACAMEDLGWDPAEPLHGPSSAWVDTDQYPTWTGVGVQTVETWDYRCYRLRRQAESERRWSQKWTSEAATEQEEKNSEMAETRP